MHLAEYCPIDMALQGYFRRVELLKIFKKTDEMSSWIQTSYDYILSARDKFFVKIEAGYKIWIGLFCPILSYIAFNYGCPFFNISTMYTELSRNMYTYLVFLNLGSLHQLVTSSTMP